MSCARAVASRSVPHWSGWPETAPATASWVRRGARNVNGLRKRRGTALAWAYCEKRATFAETNDLVLSMEERRPFGVWHGA